MGLVVYEPTEQRLYASCAGKFGQDEASMSLRVRRLFYVGKFAAVAVLGTIPNAIFLKNIIRAIVLATAGYETTGKFEITHRGFSSQAAYESDQEYVILTKKGLYVHSSKKFKEVDDSVLYARGPMAATFHVVNTEIKGVIEAVEFMSQFTSFVSSDMLMVDRSQLGDVFDFGSKDEFDGAFRLDNR